MAGESVVLESRDGRQFPVVNQSADNYRLGQMLKAGFLKSGEICCRLGIARIGSEWLELRIAKLESKP
jgi:hypothetical protein